MGSFNGETEIPYWHWGKIIVAAVSTVGERVPGGRSGVHLGTSAVVQVRDSGYCARMAGEMERTSLYKYEMEGLSDELHLEVRKTGVHSGAEVLEEQDGWWWSFIQIKHEQKFCMVIMTLVLDLSSMKYF